MNTTSPSFYPRLSIRLLLLAGGMLAMVTGCGNKLHRVTPTRGAPGEVFTLRGADLLSPQATVWQAPELRRSSPVVLAVEQASATEITVRIPAGTPAGRYDVYAYTAPLGALNPARTNGLSFWVTAAPVPAAVTDPYEIQVKSFRSRYQKSASWEDWMLANRSRYEPVFQASFNAPFLMKMAVSYFSPITYVPPWADEAEHMKALRVMAETTYPGYRFDFSLTHDPKSAYLQVLLGVPGSSSANAQSMGLHFEGIFAHEFAHVWSALHHYDTDAQTGDGLHFPPDEIPLVQPQTGKKILECVMDRTGAQFCSACRTAMNIPLDLEYRAQAEQAINAANAKVPQYPPPN